MTQGTGRSLSIVVAVSLAGWLFVPHDATSGLYQCRTNDGLIYTDTPTQLTQCSPISQSGGPSQLGLVGGSRSGSAPAASTPVTPQSQPASPPTPEVSPTPGTLPASTDAPPPSPCPTGINPLNPLSGVPCLSTEVPTPAPPAVPTDSNTPPSTGIQP